LCPLSRTSPSRSRRVPPTVPRPTSSIGEQAIPQEIPQIATGLRSVRRRRTTKKVWGWEEFTTPHLPVSESSLGYTTPVLRSVTTGAEALPAGARVRLRPGYLFPLVRTDNVYGRDRDLVHRHAEQPRHCPQLRRLWLEDVSFPVTDRRQCHVKRCRQLLLRHSSLGPELTDRLQSSVHTTQYTPQRLVHDA